MATRLKSSSFSISDLVPLDTSEFKQVGMKESIIFYRTTVFHKCFKMLEVIRPWYPNTGLRCVLKCYAAYFEDFPLEMLD